MVFSSRIALLLGTCSLLALHLPSAYADPPAAQAAPAAAPTATSAPAAPPVKSAGDSAGAVKTYPDQASVAAKTAFGTVPASDKSVTAALDAKALTDAAKLVDKPGSFQGTVVSVYSPKNHGFVALDFAAHYRDALTADIAPADYTKFPDLTQLAGKHVLVSGKFVSKGSQTQLAVTSPDQIKIVP